MDKRALIKEINKFINRVSKDFRVDVVIFFGSRARGMARKDSDIDLIIVSNDFEDMDTLERAYMMYKYWGLDIPVDFLCYTNKEFERLKNRITIVKEALKDGIVVGKFGNR